MGPVEFALISVLIMGIYTRYRALTLELGLRRREKMIPSIKKILNNPKSSPELKALAINVFHISTCSNVLPIGMIAAIFYKGPSRFLNCLTKTERKQYFELIRKYFLPTNFLTAPHWYALLLLVYLVFVILPLSVTSGTARIKTMIESILAKPLDRKIYR